MNALTGIGLALATVFSMAAPLKANQPSRLLDIKISTVAQDLEVMYSDRYGSKAMENLTPNRYKGDPYSDFKFLNFYPYQGDLYFYFYMDTPYDLGKVFLEYSDGNTFDSEGLPIERWHVMGDYKTQATIKSVYGLEKCFYKCVLTNFYDYSPGSNHRIQLGQIIGSDNSEERMTLRRCDDVEFLWEDPEQGDDMVYHYFKDNYVVVDSASYYQQWVATKFNNSNQNYPTEMRELNWLFFSTGDNSTGKDLKGLKKVVLDYEYLQYTASYEIDDGMNSVYMGTRYHAEPHDEALRSWNPRNYQYSSEITSPRQTTITPDSHSIKETTDTPSWFQFWLKRHEVEYTYNTLQPLDNSSLNALTDKTAKTFFIDNRESFEYAILMKEDTRKVTSVVDIGNWFKKASRVTSVAHELVSANITTLVYNTEFGDCELNAIMDPVDLSGIFGTTANNYEVNDFENSAVATALKVGFYSLLGVAVLFVGGIATVGVIKFANVIGVNNKPKNYNNTYSKKPKQKTKKRRGSK